MIKNIGGENVVFSLDKKLSWFKAKGKPIICSKLFLESRGSEYAGDEGGGLFISRCENFLYLIAERGRVFSAPNPLEQTSLPKIITLAEVQFRQP